MAVYSGSLPADVATKWLTKAAREPPCDVHWSQSGEPSVMQAPGGVAVAAAKRAIIEKSCALLAKALSKRASIEKICAVEALSLHCWAALAHNSKRFTARRTNLLRAVL